MYVRKEAVLSSQIEGTQSSLQDVMAAEAKILSPDRPRDVDEVVNDLVSRFVASGILTEITGQSRNRRFMYQSYINLFHDDEAEDEV